MSEDIEAVNSEPILLIEENSFHEKENDQEDVEERSVISNINTPRKSFGEKIDLQSFTLPAISNWPIKSTSTLDYYDFEKHCFQCSIKDGQLFGYGYFYQNRKCTASKNELIKIDHGLWRGRHLLFLDFKIQHNSKIYEIVDFISDEYLSVPNFPVLAEVEAREKEKELTNEKANKDWEISAILSEDDGNSLADVKIRVPECNLPNSGNTSNVQETVKEFDTNVENFVLLRVEKDSESDSRTELSRVDEIFNEEADNTQNSPENENKKTTISETLEQPSINLHVSSIPGQHTNTSLLYLKAIESNDFQTVMQLLQTKSVDVNVADQDGITGLMLAAVTTFNPKLVNFLLDHGANVKQTIKKPSEFSPLRVCLSIGFGVLCLSA